MTTARAWRGDVLVPALLVLLSAVPAVFGTVRLAALASSQPVTEANARFFAAPVPVVLHIVAVMPYTLLGAFQFSPGLRRYRWHRLTGRFLAPLGLVGALTGMWMAHFYPWPAGDGNVLYVMRLLVGSAMTASIGLGIASLFRRDYLTHGAWMTRAYALGIGAGTQVLTHLPWSVIVGPPGETARAFLMGSAWAINCIVAEYAIRRFHADTSGAVRRRVALRSQLYSLATASRE